MVTGLSVEVFLFIKSISLLFVGKPCKQCTETVQIILAPCGELFVIEIALSNLVWTNRIDFVSSI